MPNPSTIEAAGEPAAAATAWGDAALVALTDCWRAQRHTGECGSHAALRQRLAELETENAQLRAEVERLREICTGLAERVAAQSELLARRAAKSTTEGEGGPST